MYLPAHFEISDESEIFSFLESYSFGQIISMVDGRLFSSHLPFLIDRESKRLFAHVAGQNPQHRDIEGQEVLVVFQGPHDYVSPSWFASPGVPTWNYQAVHVYGSCRIIDDNQQKKSIVDRLTDKHESSFEQPWQPQYREAMLSAIVGLEVTIDEIQCKYKLSQNRTKQDQQLIKEALTAGGARDLADSMDPE